MKPVVPSTDGTELVLPVITKDGYENVKATLIDLAPHLASVGTFALHRGLKSDEFYKRHWFVTNVESGYWVGYAWTKDEAIERSTEKLQTITPRKLLQAYRKVGATNGS